TASARPPRVAISAAASFACSSRAAATIVAPCVANSRAIARPIPRDAPVTSATLPLRLNMRARSEPGPWLIAEWLVAQREHRQAPFAASHDLLAALRGNQALQLAEIIAAAEIHDRRLALNLAHQSFQPGAGALRKLRC